MKLLLLTAALSFTATTLLAQSQDITIRVEERTGDSLRTTTVTVPDTDTGKHRKRVSISLGSDGVQITKNEKHTSITKDSTLKKPAGPLKIQWGMVDLGFNRLDDRTVYNGNPDQYNFFASSGVVPDNVYPNKPFADYDPGRVFRLREGKSINVNVWILNARLRLLEGKRQRLYLTSGLGLQMYNFRFESNVMYKSDPVRLDVIPSNLTVEKNKLGFTYAAVPLGLLAKTRIGDKWLVYGAGVTGGYRIASWTKLKTEQNGKEKNHDPFNFADFNACVTAEVGLDNFLRLYGSYQLTALQKDKAVLDQHPFAIGVRFLGL